VNGEAPVVVPANLALDIMAHLAIDLRRCIWSIEAPLGTRRIRIGAHYLDPAFEGFPPDDLITSLTRLRNSMTRDDQPT
jgi:hypothetical protein